MRILQEGGALAHKARVLDVGAGDAWFASRLLASNPEASVVCWDTGYDVVPPALPSSRSLTLVREPPPHARFALALLLDVLEHVEDDRSFLSSIVADRLLPGACVLVSVPAWPGLHGEHDKRLRHHRRYTPASARALLTGAGLRITRAGGLFHSLLLPRVLGNLYERVLPTRSAPKEAAAWRHGAGVTTAVDALLAADNAVSRFSSAAGLDLPGLSWWALCRR